MEYGTLAYEIYISKSLARDKVVTNPSRCHSYALASRLVSFRLPKIVRRDPYTHTCEQILFTRERCNLSIYTLVLELYTNSKSKSGAAILLFNNPKGPHAFALF